MEMGSLGPGMYKIIARDEVRHSKRVHLLRVTGYGEQQKYFLDNSTLGEHPREFENSSWNTYTVVKKYSVSPQIFKPSLLVRFTDEDGHEYTFSVRDTWTLRSLFDLLPWLKQAFGFMPNKSREARIEEKIVPGLRDHVRKKRGS